MTCRHFRNQVPREYADELRDADPLPCEVCDALPHRQGIVTVSSPPMIPTRLEPPQNAQGNWSPRPFGPEAGAVYSGQAAAIAARD